MNIQFKKWNCALKWGKYSNGRPALLLVDAVNGEPIAKATVNLPDEPLLPGEVFIKNWHENEGMLKALEKYGIVEPIGMVDTGRTKAIKCRLLVEPS